MKKTYSSVLSSLVAALIVGGCASTPPATTTSASQTATIPQSTTASANPNPASSTSTVAPVAIATPIGSAVYFDYDSFTVKDQYNNVVTSNANYLAKTNIALELDGNADERGSREYNMALGQKRADAVKRALTVLGLKADRIETISFGEDKPKAKGHDESAWAENRRVDFVTKK